nr:hypothetical protein [Tanacetum cinerariifolium]
MHSDESSDEGSPVTQIESDMDLDIREDVEVVTATAATAIIDGLGSELVLAGVEAGFDLGLVVKDINEKDKIKAKIGQNQTGNGKRRKVQSQQKSLRDKIICDLNKITYLSQQPPQNCPKRGNPVDGQYCQGCALLRKKFKEALFTYFIENGILQGLLDTSEPSNNNTNVVNALQEPFVVKQDLGKNSSQSPPHINHHCCYGCGDSLEDIFCHQCTCESCEKEENSFTYDFKSNIVDDSPNIFNPHPQPPIYSYEFCGNDAYYGHDCPLQDCPTICYNDDDDEDYTIVITPILSTEEPDNSLSMGDEHLDTILATKSNEVINSSVENLVLIPSESEGILDNMCDVPFHDNSSPLDISKDQFEDFAESNDDSTSTDDDSFSIDEIEFVKASPPDSKLISLEVVEIVILEIKALKDNPTPSSDFMTKSSSTSLNFFLEETNTFDNSLPESETFCFDSEENSSGNTTTRADISLPDYETFYDDHVKEISSVSTTTHSDFSLYDSFIFDLSINPFPPFDRSDFYEFADELAHIISPPKYDCFSFKKEPNPKDFTMDEENQEIMCIMF